MAGFLVLRLLPLASLREDLNCQVRARKNNGIYKRLISSYQHHSLIVSAAKKNGKNRKKHARTPSKIPQRKSYFSTSKCITYYSLSTIPTAHAGPLLRYPQSKHGNNLHAHVHTTTATSSSPSTSYSVSIPCSVLSATPRHTRSASAESIHSSHYL